MKQCVLIFAVTAAWVWTASVGAQEKASAPAAESVPMLVVEPGADDWVVDRFAGNSSSGPKFIQGPAREAGGLGRPGSVACAPDGNVYFACDAGVVEVSPEGVLRLVIGQRSPPDPWGWGGPGAMRCVVITPDGKADNPTAKEPSGNWNKLENWLDVGGRDRTTWPWGDSASAWDGKQFIAVWPRHHVTGEKKSNFTNCDLIASRVDGWKPLDAAGIPVAATPAEERSPGLASSGPGSLLCVYEKSEKGRTVIAARTVSTK